MKKDVTYIDSAKFESLVAAADLTWLEQAGFMKVSGAKGRNVYVAKTKRVGRVDLSGFEMPRVEVPDDEGGPTGVTATHPGITDLGGESFGAVKQRIDFSRSEEDILDTFAGVLAHMKSLGDAPVRARSNPVTGASAPAPRTGPAPGARVLTDEEKEAVKADIQQRNEARLAKLKEQNVAHRRPSSQPEAQATADKE